LWGVVEPTREPLSPEDPMLSSSIKKSVCVLAVPCALAAAFLAGTAYAADARLDEADAFVTKAVALLNALKDPAIRNSTAATVRKRWIFSPRAERDQGSEAVRGQSAEAAGQAGTAAGQAVAPAQAGAEAAPLTMPVPGPSGAGRSAIVRPRQ